MWSSHINVILLLENKRELKIYAIAGQSGGRDPVRFTASKQQRPGFRPKNLSGSTANAQKKGRGLGSVRARGAKGKRGATGDGVRTQC